MIEPSELHRYFMVREIATGREMWVSNWDVRYTVTDAEREHYRIDPAGDYFLAEPMGHRYPWLNPLRLEEVEPLPDDRGLWHPDHLAFTYELSLSMTYEGSWRQYADQQKHAA